jgi:hypothetical protein
MEFAIVVITTTAATVITTATTAISEIECSIAVNTRGISGDSASLVIISSD